LEAVPLPWSQFEHALLDIDVRVVLGLGDRNGQELTHSLFFYFPEHEALLTREFFEIVDDNYLPLERERERETERERENLTKELFLLTLW
jgi:hypothetical protein